MREHILILGHNYATQFIDVYNQYTRLFDQNKYIVTVAYLTGTPNDAVRARTIAEEVLFLNVGNKSLRTLKMQAIKTLLELTRKKKFKLVICHRYKPTYIMLWVNQFHRIPTLISVMHELGTLSSLRRRLFLTAFAPRNILFAGVSNAVRDDMRKAWWWFNKERIVTLYNMVDIPLTEPALLTRSIARDALQLSNDTFVFGNLARLVKNKDHVSLIKAFAIIKPNCPKAKLIILGEGILQDELRTLVTTLNLTQEVIFTGYLANGFSYMKAFDCFILSSIQEAFGRVLLEAMIAKLPVIATRVHGIPEVMADQGLLVEAKNVTQIAQAMRTIYAYSAAQRTTCGEQAYQHVATNFSIPAFKQQFWRLPLIKTLLE